MDPPLYNYSNYQNIYKELEAKERWLQQNWHKLFSKLLSSNRNTMEQIEPLLEELRATIESGGLPTFDHRLSYYLKRSGDEDTHIIRNRKTIPNWPKFPETTNSFYGRFSYLPLDDGKPLKVRLPYVRLKQIGSYAEYDDQKVTIGGGKRR